MSDLSQPDSDSKELSFSPEIVEQKREFKGVWIEKSLYFCSNLNWPEKLLWIEIDYLSKNGDGGCFSGNDYLSRFLQVSPGSVSNYISHLKELGLIKEVRFDGRRRYLETDRKPFDDLERSLLNFKRQPKKISEAALENLDANNKDIRIRDKKLGSKDPILSDPEGSSPKITFPCRFRRQAPVISPPEPRKILRDFIRPGTGEYAVVRSWNRLPPPARKHTELNTKTARRISDYIGQMREGSFGRDARREWDRGWLVKHGIDRRAFEERRWTVREICKVIEGPLADMYRDGYWPPEKRGLPMSLDSALYHYRNHTSFFMQAHYDPPGKMKPIQGKDSYPEVTKKLTEMGFLRPVEMSAQDWRRYHDGVRGIAGYLQEIDWTNRGARQMFAFGKDGKPLTLVWQYVVWMKGENPDLLKPSKIPERWHSGMISPAFWMWRKFMEAVNQYYGRVFKSIETEED